MRDPGIREHRRLEIQVGLLVLAAVALLVWGVLWLTDADLVRGGLHLHGLAPEAGQVTRGARVHLLGVDVGAVEAVRLEGLRVVVDLRVDHDGPLPADTRGVIQPSGFLGTQLVRLVPGQASTPLASGDTIPLLRAPDLQSLAGDLGDDASLLLERLQEVLSEATVSELREGSASLADAMREVRSLMAGQRTSLEALVENLEATSRRLATATEGEEVSRTVARLDSLSARLASASAGLDTSSHALARILGRVDEGRGSLGRLVQEEEMYDRATAAMEGLQTATEEIALLARDLRERPERYLRGLKVSVF